MTEEHLEMLSWTLKKAPNMVALCVQIYAMTVTASIMTDTVKLSSKCTSEHMVMNIRDTMLKQYSILKTYTRSQNYRYLNRQ